MSLLDRVRSAGKPAPPPAADSAPETFGFDHVEVPRDDGKTDRLSQKEFEALTLQQRVGLLVQGKLRFYRGEQQVPPSQAMKSAY